MIKAKTALIAPSADAYLRLPYTRLLIPEADGTFRGEILEFPGCISSGDNPDEAYRSLEDAARGWIEAAIAAGQHIPEPVDVSEFSGRLVLRLPKSLHKKASRLAERDGVSLNQYIVAALAEVVGERSKAVGATIIGQIAHFVTAQKPGGIAVFATAGASASVTGGFSPLSGMLGIKDFQQITSNVSAT